MSSRVTTMSLHPSRKGVRHGFQGASDDRADRYHIGQFLPTRRTPGVSTSDLLARIISGYRQRDFDKKLERMGHEELKAEGSNFEDRRNAS